MKIIRRLQHELEALREVYVVAHDLGDAEVETMTIVTGQHLKDRIKHIEGIAFRKIICRCTTCLQRESLDETRKRAIEVTKQKYIR